MIEALARIRNDSVLSRPARKSGRNSGLVSAAAARLRAFPPRLVVGAALTALLVGIGVNALVLQRARHPAPLFQPRPATVVAPAPAASAPAPAPTPPAPVAREIPQPTPAPSPAVAPPAATTANDGIGAFLRGDAPPDDSHLVSAAQTALIKLGFPVKADGQRGSATDQALRAFERGHGLPVTTEITPRLVKQLNAAAKSAAH